MKKLLKWTWRVLAGLLALVTITLIIIYLMSERIINPAYSVEGRAVTIPTDEASIEHGRKIAITRGCLGCHRPDAGGGYLVDDLLLARLPAPDLTRLVHELNVAELDRSIRQGVRADGRSVLGMPSSMFGNLSDRDFGALIAYLRTLPRQDREFSSRRIGPLARIGLLGGDFHVERQVMDEIPNASPDPDDPVAHGKYLAVTSCTECHGVALRGSTMGGGVDLAVVAAYSLENFVRLMQTGIPQDGRELGLMKAVAVGRFSHFSEDELEALHAYLSSPEFLASSATRESP